jgi:hypothetical protein
MTITRQFILPLAKVSFFLFVFVINMNIAGCAFTDKPVRLSYEPVGSIQKSKGVDLIVSPIKDLRSDKKIIGVVRNMRGDKTANVILEDDQDISSWATKALISEIKLSGFNVNESESISPKKVMISGDLTTITFDTTPDFMHQTSISITNRIQHGDKLLFEKTYEGRGTFKAKWGDSSERESALKAALQDAISQFVKDLPLHLEQ